MSPPAEIPALMDLVVPIPSLMSLHTYPTRDLWACHFCGAWPVQKRRKKPPPTDVEPVQPSNHSPTINLPSPPVPSSLPPSPTPDIPARHPPESHVPVQPQIPCKDRPVFVVKLLRTLTTLSTPGERLM